MEYSKRQKLTSSLQNFVPATINTEWLSTLDMYPIGWSVCPQNNTYLQGFYINDQDNSGNYLLEEGKCSAAGLGFANQPATCKNGNWGSALDG